MKKALLFMGIATVCAAFAIIGKTEMNDLIQPGAALQKLAGEFQFTEGPSADPEGNVYFTDQPNDRIMIWSTSGQLSTFMQPSGRSNGLAFDRDGFLWSCADEKNELWRISPEKKVTVIPSGYNGKVLNGPNDLWITPQGGVYFTDPFYKRSWWDHTEKPQEIQAVYYLDPSWKTITRLTEDLVQPNGIVGTPDGKKLFVADLGAKKTW